MVEGYNNPMDISHFKKRLLEEKETLERELSRLGVHTTKDKAHWEATEASPSDFGEDLGENKPEETEMADQIEEFEERTSEERNLEIRYREVLVALERVEKEGYGICTADGTPHPIEEERIEANPAAATCMLHMRVEKKEI